MGKIVASYLVKLHLHEPDAEEGASPDPVTVPTNDVVKDAIIAGVAKELGVDEITVSLVERTDD